MMALATKLNYFWVYSIYAFKLMGAVNNKSGKVHWITII